MGISWKELHLQIILIRLFKTDAVASVKHQLPCHPLKKQMPKNFKLTILFLPTFLLCTALYAAPLKTLSLDFTRELTENNKTETTTGTLHYDVKAARVVVEVTEPLQQIMFVQDKVLEIYYPVENQAFRFIAKGRIPLPFVESIIQSTQAEYGLTTIGYSLDRHEIADNVLYTYWLPPEKAKDKFGTITLGSRDSRLISAEVKTPDGKLNAKSFYRKHAKLGDSPIPMEVTSSIYGPNSEVLKHEHVVYSNPQLNAQPPNPILRFEIPQSVKVKEIKW